VLVSFYRKVHPDARGWKPIAALVREITPARDIGTNLISWLLGCAMVYLALFGVGRFVLQAYGQGVILLVLAALCGVGLGVNLQRNWNSVDAHS